MKTEQQLRKEGYIFRGLFGMDTNSVAIRSLEKLLAPHGLKVDVEKLNGEAWVKVEKDPKFKPKREYHTVPVTPLEVDA